MPVLTHPLDTDIRVNLIDYDLLSVVDIQALSRRLAIEATAVEGIPGVGELIIDNGQLRIVDSC